MCIRDSGGGAPISIQSMTNVNTADKTAAGAQIRRLEEAGCQIVRLAVPDMEAVSYTHLRQQYFVDFHYISRQRVSKSGTLCRNALFQSGSENSADGNCKRISDRRTGN